MDNTKERIRRIEVEGLTVNVDTVKAGSWQAFKLLRKSFEAESDLDKFDVMLALMEYSTDQTEKKIVKHLGGNDAQFADVVRVVSQIVSECYPKN